MWKSFLLEIEVNLDLSSMKFRSGDFAGLNQIAPFVILGVLLVGVVALILVYLRRRYRSEEIARLREETRARLLLTESGMSESDQLLFAAITGTDNSRAFIPLLESRDAFEESVKTFRETTPRDPALARIHVVRQRLGYGFGNLRNPFGDTRMLPIGSRLQCQIPRADKDVSFLTNIVGTGEHNFFVRPPMAKGKPIILRGVHDLSFKISREDDAEYQFYTKLLKQSTNEIKALILQHSQTIQKMAFRNAPRTSVDLNARFFVVKEAIASESSHHKFKVADSQFSFNGRLRDLSIGGALLVVPAADQNPTVGDWVVFQIPAAQIKEDMVGEVVRLTPLEGNNLQVHLRFAGIKEINRLKMNRFLANLAEKEPDPRTGREATAL